MKDLSYFKKFIRYDPDSGLFYWLVDRSHNSKAGDVAGFITKEGYRRLKIEGKAYSGQRIAWLFMTGEWPRLHVDHKDRNPANNCWSNLRLATQSQNKTNMSKMVSNSSGYKGVHKAEFGFQVEAKVDGKRHYVGYSTDAKEAARMYDKFVSKYDDPFLVTNEQLGLL